MFSPLTHALCGALLVLASQAPVEKFEIVPTREIFLEPGPRLCLQGGSADGKCFAALLEDDLGLDVRKALVNFTTFFDEHNQLKNPGILFTPTQVRAMAAGIAVTPTARLALLEDYAQLRVDRMGMKLQQLRSMKSTYGPWSFDFIARVTAKRTNELGPASVVSVRGRVVVTSDLEKQLAGLDPGAAEVLNARAREALHIEVVSGGDIPLETLERVVGPAVLADLYFKFRLDESP